MQIKTLRTKRKVFIFTKDSEISQNTKKHLNFHSDKNRIADNKINISAVSTAYPARIPVIKRLVFVEYRISKCWSPQSIRHGKHKSRSIESFGIKTKIDMIAIIRPINTPVQRAQTGNCFPLKKKLRSGRLWQKTGFISTTVINSLKKCFIFIYFFLN
jgi:hypothetical protein